MEKDTIQKIEKRDALVHASETFRYIADKYSLGSKRVLDIGCGYGEYMQRFRDDSVGITTRSIEVDYGAEKSRDIRLGNAELLDQVIKPEEKFDAIWCNNILEHLLSPHAFLVKLKQFSTPDTLLILGTPQVPWISSLLHLQKFRGALAVEHINFFTHKTYALTAKYAGWNVKELRSFYFKNAFLDYATHITAPHLYLIAVNNHDFKYHDRKMTEWVEDPHYAKLLEIMG